MTLYEAIVSLAIVGIIAGIGIPSLQSILANTRLASATNTVCAGELLQTQHRRNFQFTREQYFIVLEMKTAELFALSSDLSA